MTQSRIFIVEDEKIIAKGIEKQLKSMGYDVVGWAASGAEAVHKALELRPDLILMDISLNGDMDGIKAAAAIRVSHDVPIVYLTANSDDATFQRSKRTEPHGYVLKPYEDRDLQTAIEIGLYRHNMELRLRENERWLAATLGSIGDGVIATDERGRVRFMNALAESMTGLPQAEAQGKNVTEIFRIVNAKTRATMPNPVIEVLERGESVLLGPDTILIDKAGGERPIDDSAAPIRNAQGRMTGAVLVFRDITERVRLEEHLRQAQKMEAIGRLAGGIAHDFNNIMTIITGFSELLLTENPSPSDRDDSVRHIHDAGKRAAALTQQIMAFSRKQMLVPGVLNLNAVVRDMGAMVKRLIGSNIEFVADTAANLGQVKADPTQIGQVILNLAANARDAMKNGGRLVVATANAELSEAAVRQYPDVKPGRYVLLTVSDSGTGMSDEVLEHIFESERTGLGLATVYGIVKQSGGHIEVAGAAGAGTTFSIHLPMVEDAITPQSGGGGSRSAPHGSETILLVEDEETVRSMMRMVLQRAGYKVLEAADGREAVAVAERSRETIHLLMTDLMMPHLSGHEVADRLTAARPSLRVLFMSGYTEDVVVLQGIEEATVDFLHKPFKLDELKNRVREILDRA